VTHLRSDHGDGLAGDSLSGDGHVRPRGYSGAPRRRSRVSNEEEAVAVQAWCAGDRAVHGESTGAFNLAQSGRREGCPR
jgi:hypothetical protein